MKNKFSKILLISIFFILISISFSQADSSITYYSGESIIVENSNIEIISNEITINTTNSKIKNNVLLKNTSKKEIDAIIKVPLDNKELSIATKNVKIIINDLEVDYTKNDNGEYIIKTKIPAKSGKKLEIKYETENKLKNAKVIKYNFENLKDREIGKLKINFVIEEIDIPLIEEIYPSHFTFKNNTISVEYYKYNVNTITKEFIIQKETFHNLLYGRDHELSEEAKNLILKWKNKESDKNILKYYQENNTTINGNIDYNIYSYLTIKSGKHYFDPRIEERHSLLYEIAINNPNDYNRERIGKTICIDFVETEGDKKLYLNTGKYEYNDKMNDYEYIEGLHLTPEREILKNKIEPPGGYNKNGVRVIYVGEDINGEDLNATQEEIIQYVNSINADMYIRIEIYDGEIKYKEEDDDDETYQVTRIGKGMVGYYNNSDYEIAKAFATDSYSRSIDDEEEYNRYYFKDYSLYYSNYDEYIKNIEKDYYKETLVSLSNKYISTNCKVPTVVQFVGNRIEKDGKYIVEYFEVFEGGAYNDDRGINTAIEAIKTSQAQKLIKSNKQNNEEIKEKIESKISNLEILDNEKEIQEEIKKLEKQEKNEQIKEKNTEKNSNNINKLNMINSRDMQVFGIIGILIILCIMILIIGNIKRRNKNEGK